MMNAKTMEFIQRNKSAILTCLVTMLIVLSLFTGSAMGKRKVCEASDGVLVKNTVTNKEFCLIDGEGQKDYCAMILGIPLKANAPFEIDLE